MRSSKEKPRNNSRYKKAQGRPERKPRPPFFFANVPRIVPRSGENFCAPSPAGLGARRQNSFTCELCIFACKFRADQGASPLVGLTPQHKTVIEVNCVYRVKIRRSTRGQAPRWSRPPKGQNHFGRHSPSRQPGPTGRSDDNKKPATGRERGRHVAGLHEEAWSSFIKSDFREVSVLCQHLTLHRFRTKPKPRFEQGRDE